MIEIFFLLSIVKLVQRHTIYHVLLPLQNRFLNQFIQCCRQLYVRCTLRPYVVHVHDSRSLRNDVTILTTDSLDSKFRSAPCALPQNPSTKVDTPVHHSTRMHSRPQPHDDHKRIFPPQPSTLTILQQRQ